MVWEKCTIGDLCESVSNTYRGKAEKVILVNTSDIFAGEILNHVTVPNEGLKGQFKKTFMRGDILYSEIRPANKRYAFVDFDNTENYIASTKLMVIRCRTEKVRPQFLFAILTSQSIINELQILAETRSGTFPQITFSGEVAPLPIYLPNIETQDTIVAILDSLDRKIKANQQINHNLLFSAVTLSVSNGADNIGVYIPLLVDFSKTQILLFLSVFAVMTILWCFVSACLIGIPSIKNKLQRYKNILVPVIFVSLGIYILLKNHCAV